MMIVVVKPFRTQVTSAAHLSNPSINAEDISAVVLATWIKCDSPEVQLMCVASMAKRLSTPHMQGEWTTSSPKGQQQHRVVGALD